MKIKRYLFIWAFLVVFSLSGCGGESGDETELETVSYVRYEMYRTSYTELEDEDFCKKIVDFFDGKTFEVGDRVEIKDICGKYSDNRRFLDAMHLVVRGLFSQPGTHSSDDTDYYNYIVECKKKIYVYAYYDDESLYINTYTDKVERPIINIQ